MIAGVRSLALLALLAAPASAAIWTLQVAPRGAGPDPGGIVADPGRIGQPESPGTATALVWLAWGASYPDSVAWRVVAAPTGISVAFGQGDRWWGEPGDVRRQEVRITADVHVQPWPCVVSIAAEPIP